MSADHTIPPDISVPPQDAGTMGFLEHLDELRTRLIRSLMSLAVGMAVAFAFVERISAFVLGPVKEALTPGAELVAGLTESVAFNIDLAFLGGVLLAAPFITYQVWRFVAPGLYANEKRLAVPLVLMAAAGTVAGAAFSHYVLFPSTVEFLSRWWLPPGVRLLAGLTDTFGLYKSMLLAMVAVFQLPAVICLLARLRAVTPGFLWRNLRYAVLVIFVAAAVITSTGDPWNMLFTAAPMLVMYVFSIAVAWVATPRGGARGAADGSSHAMGLLLGLSIVREVWRRQRARKLREA